MLSILGKSSSMVRRLASPDFTMTLLLVTAISVALRRIRPTPKKIAPTNTQPPPAQRSAPEADWPPFMELHGVRSKLAPHIATIAPITTYPHLRIQSRTA